MRGFKKTLTVDADNTVVGDLHLTAGDLTRIDGDEATPQELRSRILFPRGSCFADLNEGVPYLSEILIKGFDAGRVRSILRQTIQSHPAIVDVPELSLDVDRSTRVATLTYVARTVEGRTIQSEEFGELVIR